MFFTEVTMRDFRFFAFRDSPQAGTAIEAAAKTAGISLSGWLREAARMHLPNATSLPALPPSSPRRRVAIPDTDVAAVATLAAEVAKLTGATIQLAKAFRETGRVVEHQAVESNIREFRTLSADLVGIIDRLHAAEASK
jgi:hypothetical protein